MLDNEPDTEQQPTNGGEAAPPPRRRRAASRPAGPPAAPPLPVEHPPAVEDVAAEPAGTPPTVATQSEVTAPAVTQSEVIASVEPSQPEVAAADLVAGDPPPARRATAKRAPRKTAAKKADAEAGAEQQPDQQSAEQPADQSDQAAPPKRAPRKRAAKKAAQPAVDGPAGWVAPSSQPTEATPMPEPDPVAPQSVSAVTAADAAVEAVPTDPVLAAAVPGADAVSDAVVADASDEPAEAESTAPAIADVQSVDAQAADSATPVEALESASEIEAAGEEIEPAAPSAPDYSWLADPFAVPAGQQPRDAAEDTDDADESSQAATDPTPGDVDEADADDDEPDEGSRRRRRRRGGRRRRRGGGDEDSTENDSTDEGDTDAGDDSEQAPQVATTEAAGSTTDDAADEADDSDGEDSEGQRRRRRRRRRRGEDTATQPDDPSDVVVRVREPRTRKRAASNTEVTGIEGSTRMEAKRQRRREGRDAGRRRAPILSEAEFLARRESVLRQMIIRQGPDLAQIAVLEDGILVEHYVDRDSAASLIGNVYLGRVQNVLPSMEAAFIDIGRGRNAVLYAGEVDWDSFGADGHNRKVEKVLKSGQMILVQVTKDPVGAKGARLTNHVSIPGRYVVYAPGGHLSGISRKLPDIERRRLKDILADLVGESASVIVRTAAEGASEDELIRDVNRLKAQWTDIESKVKAGNSPQLLYGEPDLTVRIVRDLFTEDFSELVIQGNGTMTDAYDAITGYVTHVAPHLGERIRRWEPTGSADLFSEYRLDEQIAKALERKVFLPSGGSLVIDRTEAMTVIDVNTGKFTGTGGNLEATVTSNNLEAAEEIVRQLRLRDVGGIIVIDFIDMVLPSNRELLLRRLVECLGRDRTRHQVAEVTSLGLVQMTRKKIGTGLLEAFGTECPHCLGRGYLLNDAPVDSQQQADGGTREPRGRDRGRGQDGQRNGSSRGGSARGEDSQPNGADAGSSGGDAESGRPEQGGKSGQGGRSRGGRRGRGGSAERESAGDGAEAGAPASQPELEATPEPATPV